MKTALITGFLLIAPAAQAQQLGCDEFGAAIKAAQKINEFTAAEVAAETAAFLAAAQGHAGQVSNTEKIHMAANGAMAQAQSQQDTNRLLQGDRVRAMEDAQFSQTVCQAAGLQATSAAAATAAQITRIQDAKYLALRHSGVTQPGALNPASISHEGDFLARRSLFCALNDEACGRQVGIRPQGDKMPGAILAKTRLDDNMDILQAVAVAENLAAGAVQAPALTASQLAAPGGRALYMERGGWEAIQNLAAGTLRDIFVTRRMPTIDPKQFNALAAQSGLPTAKGLVSQEDLDKMQYRDRFSPAYFKYISGLSGTPLWREIISQEAAILAQGQRDNEILEQAAMSQASTLSMLSVSNIKSAGGK